MRVVLDTNVLLKSFEQIPIVSPRAFLNFEPQHDSG